MLIVCLSALLVKRFLETPRRKWLIFFLDVTKQGASLFMVHFINLGFSVFYGTKTGTDQCAWYLTSILIDTTFGILVNWFLLKLVQSMLDEERSKSLKSGNYFKKVPDMDKYEIDYNAWLKQTFIWITIFSIMKSIVIAIQVTFPGFMQKMSDFLLSNFNTEISKLIFTVVLFPTCMNIFQFIIQDLILRKQKFDISEESILRDYFVVDEAYLQKIRGEILNSADDGIELK